jgi:hypothetical protein
MKGRRALFIVRVLYSDPRRCARPEIMNKKCQYQIMHCVISECVCDILEVVQEHHRVMPLTLFRKALAMEID